MYFYTWRKQLTTRVLTMRRQLTRTNHGSRRSIGGSPILHLSMNPKKECIYESFIPIGGDINVPGIL